jgi:ubiquinone/menaquinone biosynthesis C-methylase UbiE
MSEQDRAFVGAVPELYERHMGPMLFEPFARDLAARFAGFEGAILELAAGTGRVTRALADAAPGARITATDLNPPMLAEAARRVPAANVSFRPADAQSLPFDDGAFDAIVCQFGVMFFPDKAAAFAEARRVLRPGGRYLLSVWDDMAANDITLVAAKAMSGGEAAAFMARTPFGYHDQARIRADLAAGGFADLTIETVSLPTPAASARDAAMGLCAGSPARAEIEARGAGALEATIGAVTAALEAEFGTGAFAGTGQALVITARP